MAETPEQIEQLGKEAEKTAKSLKQISDSTYESLLKEAKGQKERTEITKLYLKAKREEISQLKKGKGELDKNTASGKLRRLEIANDIRAIRSSAKEKTVLGRVTKGVSASFLNFKRTWQILVADMVLQLGKSVVGTAKDFADAETSMKSFGDVAKNFENIPLLGGMTVELAKAVDFNVNQFKQLAQVGATFESSMINLRQAAHDANMPIKDFVTMIKNNSEIMSQLFGTVDGGVKRMSQFQKVLRDTTQDQFSQFGLNLEETTEYFKTYLMLERARGRLQMGTAQQEVEQSSKYIKNLITLSKLTGQDIETLDKRNRELAANTALQRVMMDLGPDQVKSINGLISAYGGADTQMGKLITQVIAMNTATETDTALLNQMAGGQLIPLIRQLKQPGADLVTITNDIAKAAEQGYASSFTGSLARASFALSGEFTPGLNQVGSLLKNQATTMSEEMKQRNTMTSSFVSAYDSLDKGKAIMESGMTSVYSFGDRLATFASSIPEILKNMNVSPQGIVHASHMATASAYDPSRKAQRVTLFGSEKGGFWEKIFGKKDESKKTDSKTDKTNTPTNTSGSFASGTKDVTGQRFPDFGSSGTVVKVHGPEAIIPRESPMGKIVAAVDSLLVKPNVNTTVNAPAPVVNTGNVDNMAKISAMLNNNLENISQIMGKSEKHLNTLVAISAKMEKNTGETKKGLANLSPSLV